MVDGCGVGDCVDCYYIGGLNREEWVAIVGDEVVVGSPFRRIDDV